MKFERIFLWSMKHGARLLFGLALLFAIGAVITAFFTLSEKLGIRLIEPHPNVSSYTRTEDLLLALLAPFATPATLLFTALIVNHLDRWASSRGEAPNA